MRKKKKSKIKPKKTGSSKKTSQKKTGQRKPKKKTLKAKPAKKITRAKAVVLKKKPTRKTVLVALGGNAINRKGEKRDVVAQFRNSRLTARAVLPLLTHGYRMILTHGNGPQVGDKLVQVEAARDKIPDTPLGVLVADTEGSMGYMLMQCFHNVLRREYKKIEPRVVTLLTQVLVDRSDPSLKSYTKPIGPFYDEATAKKMEQEEGWHIVEDSGRGWRRVVPSPIPIGIVEEDAIKSLLEQDYLIFAAGGGGIPVYMEGDGWLEGIDAVIDKDRASAVLADVIGADEFFILTEVEQVFLDFNKPTQRALTSVTASEIEQYYKESQFPPGSMGPKIEASVQFLRSKKFPHRKVLITSPEKLEDALAGKTGTWILPD